MSNISNTTAESRSLFSQKSILLIAYAFYVIGLVPAGVGFSGFRIGLVFFSTGIIPILIGLGIAYYKRKKTNLTWGESHYQGLIRLFWITMALELIKNLPFLILSDATPTGDVLSSAYYVVSSLVGLLYGLLLLYCFVGAAYARKEKTFIVLNAMHPPKTECGVKEDLVKSKEAKVSLHRTKFERSYTYTSDIRTLNGRISGGGTEVRIYRTDGYQIGIENVCTETRTFLVELEIYKDNNQKLLLRRVSKNTWSLKSGQAYTIDIELEEKENVRNVVLTEFVSLNGENSWTEKLPLNLRLYDVSAYIGPSAWTPWLVSLSIVGGAVYWLFF